MDIRKRIERWTADEGVSPVIAVILMVAITVVLAATVYVWVSGFATEDTGPEQAAATAKGVDFNDDGDVDWIQLTLTSGENAPYAAEDVVNSTTDPDGAAIGFLCTDASDASCEGTDKEFRETNNDEWDVGDNLWIPCQKEGNHVLSISVRDSTILDATIKCDQDATTI